MSRIDLRISAYNGLIQNYSDATAHKGQIDGLRLMLKSLVEEIGGTYSDIRNAYGQIIDYYGYYSSTGRFIRDEINFHKSICTSLDVTEFPAPRVDLEKLTWNTVIDANYEILFNNPDGDTYFVRTDGSNSNDGLSNTADGAFLTIKHAESIAADDDWVYVNAGTYLEPTGVLFDKGVAWKAIGNVTIGTDGTPTYILGLYIATGKIASFKGFTIDGTGATEAIYQQPTYAGVVTLTNCNISCDGTQVVISLEKGLIFNNCNYSGTVSGSAIDARGSDITINQGTMSAIVSGSSALFSFSDTGGTDDYTISNMTINSTSFSRCFQIAADGNYSIHDNTVNSASDMGHLYYVVNGRTGTIEIYNEDYDLSGDCTGQYVYTSANNMTWDVHDNNINLTSVVADQDVFALRNQGQITFDDNVINSESELNSKHLHISSTGSSTGTPLIRNNLFQSKALVQHVLLVGSEESTGGDNDFDGTVITGNAIYGAIYFDDTKTPTTHGLFLGHSIDGIIEHNYVNGTGIGILVKCSGDTYASDGIYNNLSINNYSSNIYSKGTRNVPIYNNTSIQTIDVTSIGIRIEKNGVTFDSGNATSTVTNKLVEAGQDFVTSLPTPGDVNYVVYNLTNNTTANVTAVDDNNTLSLDADIMTSEDSYTVGTLLGISDGCLLKNNIIYSTITDTKFSGIKLGVEEFAKGYTIDYNDIYSTQGSGFRSLAEDIAYTSLANWQDKLSDAENSINADPDLDANYSPQIGSPVIEEGEDLGSDYASQLAKDATFPNPDTVEQTGSWDMGAVESE
jgi:hypothetical protein